MIRIQFIILNNAEFSAVLMKLSLKTKSQIKENHMIILKKLSCWSTHLKIISLQSASVFLFRFRFD